MATKEENIEYWNRRETEHIKTVTKDRDDIAREARRHFKDLEDTINDTINKWYSKYASEQGISLADAKLKVSNADIESLQRKAVKYVKMKDFSSIANDDMRIYNLMMKIDRYNYLIADIGIESARFYSEEEAYLMEQFNKTVLEELKKQSGILGMNVRGSGKLIEDIVTGSWNVGGALEGVWSERLWGNRKALMNILDTELTRGLILGENPKRIAGRIRKAMDSSRYAAERLARTEMARLQVSAQLNSYNTAGVDSLIFIAEPTACKHCKPLDNTVIKVDKVKIGTNVPPIHPNCMCSTAPYIDRDEVERKLKIGKYKER